MVTFFELRAQSVTAAYPGIQNMGIPTLIMNDPGLMRLRGGLRELREPPPRERGKSHSCNKRW